VSKGPLLAVALALFGNDSYIATHSRYPSMYEPTARLRNYSRLDPVDKEDSYYRTKCRELAPFVGLLGDTTSKTCVQRSDTDGMAWEMKIWLEAFWRGAKGDNPAAEERMTRGFTAAVFLSNYIWLTKGSANSRQSLSVSYDMGADAKKPVITLAGIITCSLLLGLFLIGLGTMAFYASSSPTWTPTLDSFAMMRLGSAIPEMGLLAGYEASVAALGMTPGWIGDAEPDSEIGVLKLGVPGRLKLNREYFSY
jgi:hypothetical protein